MQNQLSQLCAPAYERARGSIEAMLDCPELNELADSFGHTVTAAPELAVRLHDLKAFTNRTWDFRGGKERWQAAAANLTKNQERLAIKTADALKMWRSSKPEATPTLFGVLGGGNMAPYRRVQYFLELANSGYTPEAVALMGSGRPIEERDERPIVESYAPGAHTEADLLEIAYTRATGYKLVDEIHIAQTYDPFLDNFFAQTLQDADGTETRFVVPLNQATQYAHLKVFEGDGYPVFSVRAPKREGGLRANTSDTYAFLRSVDAGAYLHPSARVVTVTNSIYRLFQHFDAQRNLLLPTGAAVDVVGYDNVYAQLSANPQDYLQEINSGVNSAAALYDSMSN